MIVAVTGHRSEDTRSEEDVRYRFREQFDAEPIDTLICGMANGVDLWAADEAIRAEIEVWAAKPWAGHGPRVGDEPLYERVIAAATRVVNVDESLTYAGPWVFHNRNHWMVDNADNLLAYWSGKEKGGTYECWKYAENRIPRRNIYG